MLSALSRFSKVSPKVCIAALGVFVAACGGGVGSNGASSDTTKPGATIQFPLARSLTKGDTITVRGTAVDASGVTSDNVSRPNGDNAFSYPRDIALGAANNRAIVTDESKPALLAVNLETGERVFYSK